MDHVWPKVGLARADFHARRVAHAWGREATPNWSCPEHVPLFRSFFPWQRVIVRLRKLEGEAFLKTEMADLTKVLAIRSLGSRANPAFVQNTAVNEGY